MAYQECEPLELEGGGLNSKADKATTKWASFIDRRGVAPGVSANTNFWAFTIPKGRWLLFIGSGYGMTNVWLHMGYYPTWQSVQDFLSGPNYGTMYMRTLNLSQDTQFCFRSDGAANQRIDIQVNIRGLIIKGFVFQDS